MNVRQEVCPRRCFGQPKRHDARRPRHKHWLVRLQTSRWQRCRRQSGFVALRLPEEAPRADLLPNIHLEMLRADLTIEVTWPGALASECSAWLREWLR